MIAIMTKIICGCLFCCPRIIGITGWGNSRGEHMKKLSLLALSLIASVQATDYQYVDDPVTGYNNLGVPLNMTNINSTLPTSILNNIYGMLPESTPVNPDYIAPDVLSNIRFDDDLATFATASVTFLNEGAGYRNSLGYFIYDTNNPPITKDDIPVHTIIFPNASKPGEGNMQQGDTVELGIQIFAGQSLGFFVVPNGWGWNGSGSDIFYDGPWNQPFYSHHQLNPETLGNQRHNVVFVDPVNELLVIGFDDQLITYGDRDFNDVLFTVQVTPFYAIDGVNPDGSIDSGYIPLAQDNEGRPTSTISYYPTQNGFATLMFEDQWPSIGDYDFNDLVVQYQLIRTLGSQSALERLQATYNIQARGASFHNGFALHLPGVDPSNIATLSVLKNGVPVTHDIIEDGQSDAVLIISADMSIDNATGCEMYRTVKTCRENMNLSYSLDVTFTNPVVPSIIGQPPYDPFLFGIPGLYRGDSFITPPGRGWEIHLKQFAGTSLFNSGLFNMSDDRSNGSQSYVTQNNFPWVVNIADDVDHSAEYVDLLHSYPDFAGWVSSSGFSHTDWYKRSNAVTENLYE